MLPILWIGEIGQILTEILHILPAARFGAVSPAQQCSRRRYSRTDFPQTQAHVVTLSAMPQHFILLRDGPTGWRSSVIQTPEQQFSIPVTAHHQGNIHLNQPVVPIFEAEFKQPSHGCPSTSDPGPLDLKGSSVEQLEMSRAVYFQG